MSKSPKTPQKSLLISACLYGSHCKYNGGANTLPEETLSFIGEFEEYLYKESPDSESVIEIKSTDGRKIDSDRIVNLEKNAEKLSELVKEAGFRKRMQLFGLKWSVRM